MNKKDINILIHEFIENSRFQTIFYGILGAIKNYRRSNSVLWATSLCYFSILSLVPLMAISFSIGRLLGIDHFIAQQLYKNSPLNKESLDFLLDASQKLLSNTKNGVLAGIGFIFLYWVIISMFSLIEKSLNSIWQVKKNRTFFRKISDYLTVFIFFPLTFFFIFLLSGTLTENLFFGPIIRVSSSYIGLWLFFILFYSVMPNLKVNLVPVIISSFFVSVLFNQSSVIFLKLQSVIIAYNKIYGSLSVVLIFLIWLKVIWFLILIGAHLTYILQNRHTLGLESKIDNLNFSSKIKFTILISTFVIKNFKQNDPPLTGLNISQELLLPLSIVNENIIFLLQNKIINNISDENGNYVGIKLATDYENISIETIYSLMLNYGENPLVNSNIDFNIQTQKLVDLI